MISREYLDQLVDFRIEGAAVKSARFALPSGIGLFSNGEGRIRLIRAHKRFGQGITH